MYDKISILIYLIFTFIFYYYFRNSNLTSKKEIIFNYMFFSHFYIYVFNYKSLRNLSVYFVWILFSLFHLYIYFQIKNEILLLNNNIKSTYSIYTLRNTLILLGLFQVLRFISAKIQYQELVCPGRGINATDLFDNRKPTIIDWICVIIFFGVDIYFS